MEKLDLNEVKKITSWDYEQQYFDFYRTNDGLIYSLEKPNKRNIEKTMWYDDELDAPQTNLQNFIAYNMRNCHEYDRLVEMQESWKGYKFYWSENNSFVCLNALQSCDDKQSYGVVRELTTTELVELKAIFKEYKDKYVERLTKYFKKYGEKYVYAMGYWRDR